MSLLQRIVSALAPGLMLPWSATARMEQFAWSDIFGADDSETVTRGVAMKVAPVHKARSVIVSRLADLPFELGEFKNGEFVADTNQPGWLTATEDEATTPYHRFAWSLDDILFTGWALWAVDRDEAGTVTAAERIARNLWRFDPESPTGVAVGLDSGAGIIWAPVTDSSTVLLFAGPDEGLLTTAHDAIVGWRHMERAWVGRTRNPIPLIVLQETQENNLTEDEVDKVIADYSKARMSPNGAILFAPYGIEVNALGEAKADLFNEGRNAARIDIANHVNLPVTYLDGSTATSSLTYVTQEGDRNQVIDDLEFWIAPFEARLSEADVTGSAKKVIRLNRSNLTNVPNDDHGPDRDTGPAPIPATPTAPALEA
ncbi:hypothetical protein ACF044_05055 [Microbacterium sp. NPDC016588]